DNSALSTRVCQPLRPCHEPAAVVRLTATRAGSTIPVAMVTLEPRHYRRAIPHYFSDRRELIAILRRAVDAMFGGAAADAACWPGSSRSTTGDWLGGPPSIWPAGGTWRCGPRISRPTGRHSVASCLNDAEPRRGDPGHGIR